MDPVYVCFYHKLQHNSRNLCFRKTTQTNDKGSQQFCSAPNGMANLLDHIKKTFEAAATADGRRGVGIGGATHDGDNENGHNYSTALQRNVLVTMASVLVYKSAVELACFIRIKFKITGFSRPLLHVALSSTVIFWPYLDPSDGWSYKLGGLLPAVVFCRLLYKGAFLRDPHDEDVQNFSLSSAPSELLLGPLLHAGVVLWLTLYRFMTPEAAVVAAASLGDGVAPLIGARWGRHLYSVPFSKSKTAEGSVVGVFLWTVVGCYFYLFMMGYHLPLRMILAYALIAAVAEGTSAGNLDNLVIPIILHFSMELVQRWL